MVLVPCSNSVSNQAWCSRCLALNHSRNSCNNATKCPVCHGWGHVAVTCFKEVISKGKLPLDATNGSVALSLYSSWFRQNPKQPTRPSSSRPPIFESFSDLASSMLVKTIQLPFAPRWPITMKWNVPSSSKVGPVSCSLSLGGVFSASTSHVPPELPSDQET